MKYIREYLDFDNDFDYEEEYNEYEDILELYDPSKKNYIKFGRYMIKQPIKTPYFFEINRGIDYNDLCDKLFNDEDIKDKFQILNPSTNNGTREQKNIYYMNIDKPRFRGEKEDFGFMPHKNKDHKDNYYTGFDWYKDNGFTYLGNIMDLI